MNDLDQLYQQVILDHSKARTGSPLQEATPGNRHGESHQHNPICGDQIKVRVELAENGELQKISWEGEGCSISMASASALTDLVTGLSHDEFFDKLNLFREMMRSRGSMVPDEEVLEDAAAFSGVSKFPARVKCAMLSWVATEAALLAAQ